MYINVGPSFLEALLILLLRQNFIEYNYEIEKMKMRFIFALCMYLWSSANMLKNSPWLLKKSFTNNFGIQTIAGSRYCAETIETEGKGISGLTQRIVMSSPI